MLDMFDHLNAFLRKRPDHLILHICSNDAANKETTTDDLFSRIIRLKSFAEYKVPGINVAISCPTIRTDNGAANKKLVELREILKNAGYTIITNDNIMFKHLGKKGLHLNQHGVKQLAVNMIAFIRNL